MRVIPWLMTHKLYAVFLNSLLRNVKRSSLRKETKRFEQTLSDECGNHSLFIWCSPLLKSINILPRIPYYHYYFLLSNNVFMFYFYMNFNTKIGRNTNIRSIIFIDFHIIWRIWKIIFNVIEKKDFRFLKTFWTLKYSFEID